MDLEQKSKAETRKYENLVSKFTMKEFELGQIKKKAEEKAEAVKKLEKDLAMSGGASEEETRELKRRIKMVNDEKDMALQEKQKATEELESQEEEMRDLNEMYGKAESTVRDYSLIVNPTVDKQLKELFPNAGVEKVVIDAEGNTIPNKEIKWRELASVSPFEVFTIIFKKKAEEIDYNNAEHMSVFEAATEWQEQLWHGQIPTRQDPDGYAKYAKYMDPKEPSFVPDAAFKSTHDKHGNRQFSIRWEDEVITPKQMGRKPYLISSGFAKSLQTRFGKKDKAIAEKILLYLMDKHKEYIENDGSGYSIPSILWYYDTQKQDWDEKQMTPQQKFIFWDDIRSKEEKKKDNEIEELKKTIEDLKSAGSKKQPISLD